MGVSEEKRITRSDFEALCEAIGFFVINWALAEQSLDFCALVVFSGYGGDKLISALPRPYEAKSIYVRQAVAMIEELKPFADDLISILDRMDALAKTRNDWVHGVVSSVEAEGGGFSLEKLDYGKREHVARSVKIQLADYPEIIERLLALGRDITTIGLRLEGRTPRSLHGHNAQPLS